MTLSKTSLKIAFAQLNCVVGDIEGNVSRIFSAYEDAKKQKADLIVFPELFLTGYPPEDLVLKPAFQKAAQDAIKNIARHLSPSTSILLGTIWPEDGVVYNAVVLLEEGDVRAVRKKVELPNYGVFDELRVFSGGPLPSPIDIKGVRIGVPICEDIWKDQVVECLNECGAEILIALNGSPFDWPKPDQRMNVCVARVTESKLPLAYINLVGGQDELVFDGASFVLNNDCTLALQMPAWEESLILTEWTCENKEWRCLKADCSVLPVGEAAAYSACILGLRDYVNKNGFPGVVLGLSGGVDSALVAVMAADALGPERVHAIMLPYHYTSKESLEDASLCAQALGIRYNVVSIIEPVESFRKALSHILQGVPSDSTEENIQSRVRGTSLMAISNKLGLMVLTTGNKSEMSVGYATLYGDMNGGFNPIKDLYKGEVYKLARWRNENVPKISKCSCTEAIPERIFTKPPSAELRPNQKDQDSLPPYDILDDILLCLIEKEMSVKEIVTRGHRKETVEKVERLLYLAEYKRRQAAPGVKISSRNFGRDRRYPITNLFREKNQLR
ncbi:MAG: NAD+ synthase [Hyphomicrobium sp.]